MLVPGRAGTALGCYCDYRFFFRFDLRVARRGWHAVDVVDES